MADEKASPRVIRRGQQPAGETAEIREIEANSDTFQDQLADGRIIALREMTAGDLLYLEKSLGNAGDMERSLKLAARLSCEPGRVTYDDLMKLKVKDLKVVTALLGKAGDTGEEDEEEFPNE